MDRLAAPTGPPGPCVFPAHAGMDRSGLQGLRPGRSVFPAHAGMDRCLPAVAGCLHGCSPHTRGWTGLRRCEGRRFQRVPRTRGDGPDHVHHLLPLARGVPRTRGDGPQQQLIVTPSTPVFPAHAGMDRPARPWSLDGPACSPHTRGWTEPLLMDPTGMAVFPAHAGMDRRHGSRG